MNIAYEEREFDYKKRIIELDEKLKKYDLMFDSTRKLEIENAVLKAQNESLNQQILKLESKDAKVIEENAVPNWLHGSFMKLNKNEKMVLKKYLDSIIICICSFISEDEINRYIEKSSTIPELLEQVSNSLKAKELNSWDVQDLTEEQLNVLTIISELYLKRNKSKYKM